jgi:zinc protease
VLFDTFPNGHNGYGDFRELESATLQDAADFFERYYAPGNAVLTVAGDADVDGIAALAERHFGDIPAREVPARPSFAEPPPDGERRARHLDTLAPQPAVAIGYRLPDPADLDAYLPFVLLASVLTDGDASRLEQRLVRRDQLVRDVSADIGVMGDPLDVRDPTPLVVEARYDQGQPLEPVLAALDDELQRLAADGLQPGELDRVRARLAARHLRLADSVLGRVQVLSVFEQQRGRPELLNDLPRLLGAVTEDRVAAAAAALRPDARAVLELVTQELPAA